MQHFHQPTAPYAIHKPAEMEMLPDFSAYIAKQTHKEHLDRTI